MASKRTRQWTFICYPDSAPDNWKEIIKATHIRTAISPLHDKDLNPTGEEKKPHWHIFLEFESLKSYDQVKEITDLVNATIPQVVQSPVGMIRYFIHKDNPEKHQYKWEDIEVYNGLDIGKYDTYTENELDHITADITRYIDDNEITEYSDLVSATRDSVDDELFEWYRVIRKNTIYFNAYITSRRNKLKEWKKQVQQQKISKNQELENQ